MSIISFQECFLLCKMLNYIGTFYRTFSYFVAIFWLFSDIIS